MLGTLSTSAVSYSFDSTGLSNDSRLPSYLQNLTVSQLQTALNGDSPNTDLINLLRQDITFTGAGWVPDASGSSPTSSVPSWILIGIAGLALGWIIKGR